MKTRLREGFAVQCLALVAAAAGLLVCEPDTLWRVSELNLFLHTPLFFQQCMVSSGGLLSWMGAYLTQFFHYPLLGVGVLCLLWAVLMWLLGRAFPVARSWVVLPLVPVALLLAGIVSLGYWIFYLKLRGYLLAGTLGVMAAVAMVWAYRAASRWRWGRLAVVALTVLAGYPATGFYALMAALLMALMALGKRPRNYLTAAVAVGLVVAWPLVCYHVLYHETPISNIYWTALPVFRIRQENFMGYYAPLTLTGLWLAGLALTAEKSWQRRPRWLTPVALTVVAASVVLCWYKDDNFHRELSMHRSIDRGQWEQVITTARTATGEPTRAMWMMKNLALFRLGRQGDEMFRYRNGNCRANAPFPVRVVHTEGKMLYLNYGLPNFCHRWCVEDGVVYGWNVEELKLMVVCSLLNGEQEAAQKYLRLLKKTDFCRQWAQRYEPYVHNPRPMADDPVLNPIIHLLRDDDYLSSDNALIEPFLQEHFAGAEGEAADPLYQEQALIAAMQMHDPQLFWRHFYLYTEQHTDAKRLPRHYQEAACLYGRLYPQIDISRMPLDAEVLKDCDDFLAMKQEYEARGRSAQRAVLGRRFGGTFFYDYFFNHYLESYSDQ